MSATPILLTRSGCNQPPLAPADGNRNANPTAHNNAMINPFCFAVAKTLQRPRWRGRPAGAAASDSSPLGVALFCSWISSCIRDRLRLQCPVSVEHERGRSVSLFVESLTLLQLDDLGLLFLTDEPTSLVKEQDPETELYLFDPKA